VQPGRGVGPYLGHQAGQDAHAWEQHPFTEGVLIAAGSRFDGRTLADERVEDYRGQLEEYRRREADRAQEHRDRVAELRARIDDLTHADQRET
jgi:hypothetical protein